MKLIYLVALFPENTNDFSIKFMHLAVWPFFGGMSFLDIFEEPTLSTYRVIYGYFQTIIYFLISNIILINLLVSIFKYF